MSDFDDVLERLLTDPPFAAALAADPDVALAGYTLDAGEAELLRSQVAGDTGADVARVETRTNKSSTFGLLAPFAAMSGVVDSFGHALADPGHTSGLGSDPGHTSGLGSAPPDAWGRGGAAPAAHSGLGDAPRVHEGLGNAAPHEGLGNAPQQAISERSLGHAEPPETALPEGYHPRVDVDGDGHWDRAVYRTDPDARGGDILVDKNRDGKPDFIGHDTDLDGKVDYADYDKNHDGVFEKRMYDDDNDGWLDRTVNRPEK
jgi:hypothetical protein